MILYYLYLINVSCLILRCYYIDLVQLLSLLMYSLFNICLFVYLYCHSFIIYLYFYSRQLRQAPWRRLGRRGRPSAHNNNNNNNDNDNNSNNSNNDNNDNHHNNDDNNDNIMVIINDSNDDNNNDDTK